MAKKIISLSGKIKRIHANEGDIHTTVMFTLEGDTVIRTMLVNYEVYTNSLRLTAPGDVVQIEAREDTGFLSMAYPTVFSWTNVTLNAELGRSQPNSKS